MFCCIKLWSWVAVEARLKTKRRSILNCLSRRKDCVNNLETTSWKESKVSDTLRVQEVVYQCGFPDARFPNHERMFSSHVSEIKQTTCADSVHCVNEYLWRAWKKIVHINLYIKRESLFICPMSAFSTEPLPNLSPE